MFRISITSKSIKFLYFIILSFTLISFFSGCKKDEEDPYETVNVRFMVSGENATKKAIVTQIGTIQNTIFNPTDDTWVSASQLVSTKEGAVHLAATGLGSGVDSKLIVSIWINGEKKATDTATGINLKAETVVEFNK